MNFDQRMVLELYTRHLSSTANTSRQDLDSPLDSGSGMSTPAVYWPTVEILDPKEKIHELGTVIYVHI
jgi:hypothetical protein